MKQPDNHRASRLTQSTHMSLSLTLGHVFKEAERLTLMSQHTSDGQRLVSDRGRLTEWRECSRVEHSRGLMRRSLRLNGPPKGSHCFTRILSLGPKCDTMMRDGRCCGRSSVFQCSRCIMNNVRSHRWTRFALIEPVQRNFTDQEPERGKANYYYFPHRSPISLQQGARVLAHNRSVL